MKLYCNKLKLKLNFSSEPTTQDKSQNQSRMMIEEDDNNSDEIPNIFLFLCSMLFYREQRLVSVYQN